LAYLIYQVRAPAHLFPEEEVIRHDLAAQIYGLQDDAPDIFNEDDGDMGMGMFD